MIGSPHIRLVINQVVELDAELGNWQFTPPDVFKDVLNPAAQPDPWMKAVISVVAEATMTGQNVDIEVIGTPEKWLMKVTNR